MRNRFKKKNKESRQCVQRENHRWQTSGENSINRNPKRKFLDEEEEIVVNFSLQRNDIVPRTCLKAMFYLIARLEIRTV